MKRHDRERADARARLQDLLGSAPAFDPPPGPPGRTGSESTGPVRPEVEPDDGLSSWRDGLLGPAADPGGLELLGRDPADSLAVPRPEAYSVPAAGAPASDGDLRADAGGDSEHEPDSDPVHDLVEVLEPPAGDAAPTTDGYEFLALLERGPGFSRWYARSRAPERDGEGTVHPAGARERSRRARRRRDEDDGDFSVLSLDLPGMAAERMVLLTAAVPGEFGLTRSVGGGALPEQAEEDGGPTRVRSSRALGELRHPHLLRVHDLRPVPPDGLLVATDLPEGGSLAEVLGARTRLAPGEAARVLGDLGSALAAVRVVTADPVGLDPDRVWFARDGRAMLVPPLGPWAAGPAVMVSSAPADEAAAEGGLLDSIQQTAERGVPGEDDAEAADVLGLSRLAWRMLTGREPGPVEERIPLPLLCPGLNKAVVMAVEAGLDEDPALRPPMAELLQIFRGATEEVPVDLHESVRPEFAVRLPARRTPRTTGGEGALPLSAETGPASSGGASGGTRPRRRPAANGRGRHRTQSVLPGRRSIHAGPVPSSVRLQEWARRRRRPLLAGAALLLLSGTALGFLHPRGAETAADAADSAPGASSSTDPAVGGPAGTGRPDSTASETAAAGSRPGARNGVQNPVADAAALQEGFQTVLTARDAALAAHDPARIGDYAVAGGELATQDAMLLGTTADGTGASRQRAAVGNWTGLASTASDVEVLGFEAGSTRVRAAVHVSGYSPQAGETARGDGAGGSKQVVEAVLTRSSSGWKAVSVRAVG